MPHKSVCLFMLKLQKSNSRFLKGILYLSTVHALGHVSSQPKDAHYILSYYAFYAA